MLVDMQKQMQHRDAQIDSILAHNKIMDNQIAQLSSALQTRQQGALPSQPVQPTDHVNAITLRSGSRYDGPSMPKDDEPTITNSANPDSVIPNTVVTRPAGLQGKTNISDDTLQGITPKKDKNQDKSGDVQKPVIKLPFPNRHLKSKLDKQFGKFLEVVKNLQDDGSLGSLNGDQKTARECYLSDVKPTVAAAGQSEEPIDLDELKEVVPAPIAASKKRKAEQLVAIKKEK
ncbi:uncharacterized protein LOC110738500 [Chenopodium quinoa]|uniref:uncharacterized protein LOC110738500 n=1 Tax=Chenopodium quinoa TaxID=63459 RepID=UPI000B782BF3|nr:uncharacterized protein LOC110738500 [Chenopodium quinoa]